MSQMRHGKRKAVKNGSFLIAGVHGESTVHNTTVKKFFTDWTKRHRHQGINHKINQSVGLLKSGFRNGI